MSMTLHSSATFLNTSLRIPPRLTRLILACCFASLHLLHSVHAQYEDAGDQAMRDAYQQIEKDKATLEKEALDAKAALKDESLQNDDFVAEWSKHMEGFTPDLTLTFDLVSGEEHFFTEIKDEKAGELIRGAFFASGSGGSGEGKVRCDIHDPNGKIIFDKTQEQGIFYFKGTVKGTYVISFSSASSVQGTARVSVTLGKGLRNWLSSDHIASLDTRMQQIEKALVDIQSESTYLWVRQMSAMKGMVTVNSRVFWLCVAEFIILFAVAGLQMYYVKGLLSDHRRLDYF